MELCVSACHKALENKARKIIVTEKEQRLQKETLSYNVLTLIHII